MWVYLKAQKRKRTNVVANLLLHVYLASGDNLASFPGPAQLSVAFSTVKWRGPGIFSHVSDVRIEKVVERD